jgi:hypothetical protein
MMYIYTVESYLTEQHDEGKNFARTSYHDALTVYRPSSHFLDA